MPGSIVTSSFASKTQSDHRKACSRRSASTVRCSSWPLRQRGVLRTAARSFGGGEAAAVRLSCPAAPAGGALRSGGAVVGGGGGGLSAPSARLDNREELGGA